MVLLIFLFFFFNTLKKEGLSAQQTPEFGRDGGEIPKFKILSEILKRIFKENL